MSVPKFTPGPWVVEDHTHRNGVETFRICHGRVGEVVAFMESRDSEANAHLIAAAPDLYEALEALANHPGCEDYYCGCGCNDDEVQAARAALAKARGETP